MNHQRPKLKNRIRANKAKTKLFAEHGISTDVLQNRDLSTLARVRKKLRAGMIGEIQRLKQTNPSTPSYQANIKRANELSASLKARRTADAIIQIENAKRK
jgi:hypothetical protein